MTNASMQLRTRRETRALAHDGPVLLATKPFNGLDAPLAVARWLAAREDRELRVVSGQSVSAVSEYHASPLRSRVEKAGDVPGGGHLGLLPRLATLWPT